jgi:SH3-like domain-containing protein
VKHPNIHSSHYIRLFAVFALIVLFLLALSGCKRKGGHVLEVNYVSAVQATLRDQVATIYSRVGTVKNGERVEVLEHEKRFARVRTAAGVEGWIEQRSLVDEQTYDALQKLTRDNLQDPVQAMGSIRNDTNLHLTPGRETEHLYQLSAGAKVSVLKRATADKLAGPPAVKPAKVPSPQASPSSTQIPAPQASSAHASAAQISAAQTPAAQTVVPAMSPTPSPVRPAPAPVLEDWWLVRDPENRVGWVLARMVDLDVPLEIAQYAEGQRFVASFILDQVKDEGRKDEGRKDEGKESVGKSVPQYLCAITEPHDGLPYDYDQIRVFTWNVRKHRYETAYREHGLNGVLPITLTTENFDKEGTLPVFILRVKDDSGNVSERKYKLNTPIVRRVLAPGEQKLMPKPASRPPAKTAAKRRRRKR